METHLYILARAFTVSRKKVWKKHIHIFLPGPSLFPGTKYGRSTSIHSCQSLHCFQEQSMEEAHPYILAWDLTVSRNKEWRKHIHTFLPGSSLFTVTKNGSTSIHSCQDLHCFQEQSMEKAHPYILQGLHCFQEQSMEEAHPYILARVFTVSRNKVWRKHIHTFLPKTSLIPETKYGGITSIHSCQGRH